MQMGRHADSFQRADGNTLDGVIPHNMCESINSDSWFFWSERNTWKLSPLASHLKCCHGQRIDQTGAYDTNSVEDIPCFERGLLEVCLLRSCEEASA